MRSRRWLSVSWMVVLVLALLLVPAAPPGLAADFDRDRYADLAVGVEWEDVGSIESAGAVNILYGWSNGISASGDQIWDQDDLVAADGSEADDYFGYRLAAGDFNGDGAADLAVGVPGEDIGTAADGGAVHVLYGTPGGGLAATDNQLWHQGSSGIQGAVESGDRFGASLAVGDFNGDGRDDVAVGAPDEDIEPEARAGAVNVLCGTASGLSATGDQIW
jgi:hypothetical protein